MDNDDLKAKLAALGDNLQPNWSDEERERLRKLNEERQKQAEADAARRDHTKVWVRGEGLTLRETDKTYRDYLLVGFDAEGREHDVQDAARPEVRIELIEENRVKMKWGDRIVRKEARLKIWLNGYLAYDEYANSKDYFLKRILSLIDEIREHPSGYWHTDIVGREVYWRDTPAIVARSFDSRVVLRASTPDGFPDAAWAKESYEKLENRHEVVTSVFDQSIWWWRKGK